MDTFQLIGFPLFAVSALELLLGFILLRQNPNNSNVNKAVAVMAFFSSAFALCTAIMYTRASMGLDFNLYARANWIGWFNIPAALQFVFYMRSEKSTRARFVGWVLYPFWSILLGLSLFTDHIVTGNYSLIPYVNEHGPIEEPARLMGSLMLLWVMYEVIRLRREVSGTKKRQLNYFLCGLLIFGGGASISAGFLQLLGGFGFEPGLGSYFGFPWVVLTFYAIIRYSLFDARIIISRSLSIVLLSAIFSLIQIVMFKLLEPTLGAAFSVFISLPIIGFIFFGTPLSRAVQSWISNIVIKDKYDYQRMLKESTKALVSILNLDDLLSYIIDILRKGFGVENACLYLRGKDGRYSVRQSFGIQKNNHDKRTLSESIVRGVNKTGRPVIGDGTGRNASDEEWETLNAFMRERGAELIIPLFYKERLLGALTLGRKGGGERYVQSDIDLLETLANHAAVAIENARLYEETRQVRASLQESEEKFYTLARTIPAAIFIYRAGKFLYANPAGETLTGYSKEELRGLHVWDIVHPDYREMVKERSNDLFFEEHISPHQEFKIVKKDSEERWVIMSAGVIEHEGKPTTIGAILDITDRFNLEGKLRYAQKMEAIGKLAGGVAHDFNNVLTGIVGHGSILQASMDDREPLRYHVDQILASSERAAKLTRSLLNLGARQEAKFSTINLNDVVRNMETFLSGLLRKDILLVIQTVSGVLPVDADNTQIERIVMNLVVNARDAMPGGGALTIETGKRDIDSEFISSQGFGKLGAYAYIAVKDTGAGMDDNVRARIFEPFFTTKSEGKGTGFGLSIVYDLMKKHEGYVNVASEPGKGSLFTLYFPVANTPVEELKHATLPVKPRGHQTILVAEDDETIRSYTNSILREAGYTVVEAIDGEEAVKKYSDQGQHIDLLILDIIMPRMNGREAYRTIRKTRPDVRVLFTSGYDEELLHKTSMLEPGQQFLLKPVSQHGLLSKIKEMLNHV